MAGRPVKTPAEREIEYARAFPIDWARRLTRDAWGWPDLEVWQMKVLASNSKRLMLNCSRQIGKSSILAVKAFWKALTEQDALILIVAEQRQSNEDMRKVKQLAQTFDKYLKEKYDNRVRLLPISDNITSIEFGHGSRVVALPANEKVRGFSAPAMVIIDEAGYVPDEVFVAIDPMMTVSQGQMILASTPHGTSGFFYTEHKNPMYEKIEVPWNQSPRIQAGEIELKRQIYGDAYIKQEYEISFLDDVAALFTERSLRDSVDETEDVFSDQVTKFEEAFLLA